MNYRQRKKAYKKKYGVNPNEMLKAFSDITVDWQKVKESIINALNTVCDVIKEFAENAKWR